MITTTMRGCPGTRLDLAMRLQRRCSAAAFTLNATAGGATALYMFVVFPPEGGSGWGSPAIGLTAVAIYTSLAGLTAYRRARPWFKQLQRWLAAGRPPTDEERRVVLRLPLRFARMTLVRWAVAVPLFLPVDLAVSEQYALEVATTTMLAGLTTTAAVYLTTEWLLRPAFALALDASSPPEARSLGIGPRLLLTWLLCTGVPVLMIALIPVGRDVDRAEDLVAPIWFAAAMALFAGLLGTKLATQAVARPVRALRRAVDSVGQGDLAVSVPVDDGSEVGRLQAGFNAMVAGLREREQLRDLYGRQVGPEVARAALERGWELGGERREVSVLFVDVIGSTALAQREPPERVVALLNEFFTAVVAVVHGHRGLVNKFEGDAALCFFGAPLDQDDHASRALAAARELRPRLDRLDCGLDAAIGVASGPAVAGYVGAEARFEYTVVGDPVNEAARLSELAKQHAERLLASGETVRRAEAAEAALWAVDGEVLLRGRRTATRLAIPTAPRPAAATATV